MNTLPSDEIEDAIIRTESNNATPSVKSDVSEKDETAMPTVVKIGKKSHVMKSHLMKKWGVALCLTVLGAIGVMNGMSQEQKGNRMEQGGISLVMNEIGGAWLAQDGVTFFRWGIEKTHHWMSETVQEARAVSLEESLRSISQSTLEKAQQWDTAAKNKVDHWIGVKERDQEEREIEAIAKKIHQQWYGSSPSIKTGFIQNVKTKEKGNIHQESWDRGQDVWNEKVNELARRIHERKQFQEGQEVMAKLEDRELNKATKTGWQEQVSEAMQCQEMKDSGMDAQALDCLTRVNLKIRAMNEVDQKSQVYPGSKRSRS